MSRTQIRREQIEQRLRGALEARAYAVGLDDLRPAVTPTGSRRTFLPARRSVVVLFTLAAAVASILLVLTGRQPTTSVNPADTPSVSRSPSPSPSPSTPSPVAPGPVPPNEAESSTGAVQPPGEPAAGPAGAAGPSPSTGH